MENRDTPFGCFLASIRPFRRDFFDAKANTSSKLFTYRDGFFRGELNSLLGTYTRPRKGSELSGILADCDGTFFNQDAAFRPRISCFHVHDIDETARNLGRGPKKEEEAGISGLWQPTN